MPTDDSTFDPVKSYVDASAALLGLDIAPEWMTGVRNNLEICFRFARLIEQFPLPDATEPAPVYEA